MIDQRTSQAGDTKNQMFTRFYEPLTGELFRYAYYFVGDKYTAQEAVSEAALNAYSAFGNLRDPSKFRAWIFKILCNVCKRYLKNPGFQTVSIVDAESLPSSGFSGELDNAVAIKEALDTLKPREKTIVLLCVVGRYTSPQVAELLEIPPSTVRSHLKRALHKLRIILGDSFAEN